MTLMKKFMMAASLVALSGHARCEDDDKGQLYPTGLTIVVMNEANHVLDTVKVADDKKSYEITLKTSETRQKIKVIALGTRINKTLPEGVFTMGRSKELLDGIDKVIVTIDAGNVISIKGDGFGTFALTEEIRKGVIGDLKEGKQADLTMIEELVEEKEDPNQSAP